MPKYSYSQQTIIDKAKEAKTPDQVKKFLEEFLVTGLSHGFDFFSRVMSKLDRSVLEVAVRSKPDLFRHIEDRFEREFEYFLDFYNGMKPLVLHQEDIKRAASLFFKGSEVARRFLGTIKNLGQQQAEDLLIFVLNGKKSGVHHIDELFKLIPDFRCLKSIDLLALATVDYDKLKKTLTVLKDSLESLTLPRLKLTTESSQELLSLIEAMPRLKHINIGSSFGENAVEIMSRLVSRGVTSIDDSLSKVGGEIFNRPEIAQNVEAVYFRSANLSHSELEHIARNINRAPKLHTLDLSYNITNEMAAAGVISELSRTVPDSSLRELVIESNYIVRPQDLEALAEIQLKTNLMRGNGNALPADSELALIIRLRSNFTLPQLSEDRVARIKGEVAEILLSRAPQPSVENQQFIRFTSSAALDKESEI
jgi:hypothetical protein